MIAARQAKSFRIALTAEWWDLPLNPATRDAEIEALVAERRADATPALRRTIVTILSRTAAAAHDIGAGLCAEYGTAEEGQLVGASLLVTEAPGDLSRADLEALAEGMAAQGFVGPADPPLAESSVVTLNQVGRAIRVRFDPQTAGADSPAIGSDSLRLQFFVPVPGTGATAVVTFSSPALTGHEPFDDLVQLFDAIAGTFCFLDEQGEQIPPAA
ncbi:MAG: phage baseplate upper protein [Acidimicrobiaceae bacterium]|nr:phage baseplate upper protein [Acidimicrobiaceae bacterium]